MTNYGPARVYRLGSTHGGSGDSGQVSQLSVLVVQIKSTGGITELLSGGGGGGTSPGSAYNITTQSVKQNKIANADAINLFMINLLREWCDDKNLDIARSGIKIRLRRLCVFSLLDGRGYTLTRRELIVMNRFLRYFAEKCEVTIHL